MHSVCLGRLQIADFAKITAMHIVASQQGAMLSMHASVLNSTRGANRLLPCIYCNWLTCCLCVNVGGSPSMDRHTPAVPGCERARAQSSAGECKSHRDI